MYLTKLFFSLPLEANIFSIIQVLDKIHDAHEGQDVSGLDLVAEHMQNLMTRGLSDSFNIFICFTCPNFSTSLKELLEHTQTKNHKNMAVNANGQHNDWLRCEICAKV